MKSRDITNSAFATWNIQRRDMELWDDKPGLPLKAKQILQDVAAFVCLVILIALLLTIPLVMEAGR